MSHAFAVLSVAVVVALPIVAAWGALGWYGFLALSRDRNRLNVFKEMQQRPRLSETPEMRFAITWEGK